MEMRISRRKFIKMGTLTGSFMFIPSIISGFARSFKSDEHKNGLGNFSLDLEKMGLLDITKVPFFADPSRKKDPTKDIQDAVNEERNSHKVCFFPILTYLITDTISYKQRVEKLEMPKYTDSSCQSWGYIASDRHYLLGSTKDGKQPVLKLSPNAKGFDSTDHTKNSPSCLGSNTKRYSWNS